LVAAGQRSWRSARSTTTLADLRAKLTRHTASPAVRDFLDATR
jgi:hypothetical protein